MPTPRLTPEIISAAIEGYEAQKVRIDAQIAELRSLLSSDLTQSAAMSEAAPHKRKRFSAVARKRMREAQQRRWARIRGESEPPASPKAEPPKRRISEEGMKRIIAGTKKRWALKHAAAKAQKASPARKKVAAKKAVVKAAPAKGAKRAQVKKTAGSKKTASAPMTTVTEAAV